MEPSAQEANGGEQNMAGHPDMPNAQAAYDQQVASLADVKKRRKEYVNDRQMVAPMFSEPHHALNPAENDEWCLDGIVIFGDHYAGIKYEAAQKWNSFIESIFENGTHQLTFVWIYSIERDAQLLANRIALLKQEEMKTWKKIEETKKRTGDITSLKKRNEEKVQKVSWIIEWATMVIFVDNCHI